jgi:membrane fusion protein (multidrug efflux system)
MVEQPVAVSNELTGRVVASTVSDVRPQVNGIIQSRLFSEGQLVHAGEPLYQIDESLFKAARDQAAAQLENAAAMLATAQAKADRYSTLTDVQAVSRQDIDDTVAAARQARANVHQAQANLKAAKVNLAYTSVVAPISGRIGRSAATPGALVTADQIAPLASIQRLDPIYVDISQSSQQLLAFRKAIAEGRLDRPTASVKLKLEDGSEYPETGTIEFAEVTVDPNSGAVILRARFPNPGGVLLPGMFVRIEAPQGVAPKAILAPQQGVVRDAKGNASAFVVDAADKAEPRTITVDRAIGNTWLVTRGLNAGDRLVIEGNADLSPGTKVDPVPVRLAY